MRSRSLLMDEPFGALDAQTRELMQEELLAIIRRSPKTTVFVTHDVREAIYLADRVAIMMGARPGRIKEVVDTSALSGKRRFEFGVFQNGELYVGRHPRRGDQGPKHKSVMKTILHLPVVLLAAVWEIVSYKEFIDPSILPSLSAVFRAWLRLAASGDLVVHGLSSIAVLLEGLAIAIVVGTVLGVSMAWSILPRTSPAPLSKVFIRFRSRH